MALDIKMLQGNFTKMLNYTKLSVSSVSHKQSCLQIPAKRLQWSLYSSWWRQSIPTCAAATRRRDSRVLSSTLTARSISVDVEADRRKRRASMSFTRVDVYNEHPNYRQPL